MKFDGKAFARTVEAQVKNMVTRLGGKPKIVSFLVGDDPASALYTRLKKEAAERVGVEFEICRMGMQLTADSLRQKIAELGVSDSVTGIMVQLPIPGVSRKDTEEILRAVPLEKDVDGLRYPESKIVPPVVEATLKVIEEIVQSQILNSLPAQAGQILKLKKYVVIGASGFVGSAIVLELAKQGIDVVKVESDTEEPARSVLVGDIVISCVGKEGIVTKEMVKDGAVVIDVGAPKGDMTREVYAKASVSVEVPGGVGPVTIACLIKNAVEMYD